MKSTEGVTEERKWMDDDMAKGQTDGGGGAKQRSN